MLTDAGIERLHQLVGSTGDEATVSAACTILAWLGEPSPLPLPCRKMESGTPVGKAQHSPAIEDELILAALEELGAGLPLESVLEHVRSAGKVSELDVLNAIGRQGTPASSSALVSFLKRGDAPPHLEFAIIHALSRVNCHLPAAADVLVPYLHHSDSDLRRLALQALTVLSPATAFPHIVLMARDPHWSVRIEVLRSLAKTGGTQAAPYLLAALGDHDILVKKSAASFLGELRSLDAVGTLVTLLCNKEVGRQAFDALMMMGEGALPLLHESARRTDSLELRERIIDLVGRLGSPESIPLLLELLGDPSPVIRLAAVHSFWNCRDASVPARLAELRERDPDEGVRYAAKVIGLSLKGESG